MESQVHSTHKILQLTSPSLYENRNAEKQLAEYQKNMKLFIKSVQKQTSALIDKYQNQIKALKAEIKRLNQQLTKKTGHDASTSKFRNKSAAEIQNILGKDKQFQKKKSDKGFGLDLENLQSHGSGELSPIKHRGISNIINMDTARSNFFQELPMKNFFGIESNIFGTESKLPNFDYKFQLNKTADKLNKSRFQMESKKKRQRQQDLLHYLESGRGNLDINTDKMFNLLGRSRNLQEQVNVQNQEEKEVETPTKKRKGSLAHNQSLSSICDSLNNSFHGKKAQAKHNKKRKQAQAKQLQQSRKEQERQKRKKQQGIKNLLTTMRKNISSSVDRPAEVIKASKLLTTGQATGKSPMKAKVMINPVPVDLLQRNKQKQRQKQGGSGKNSPTKPQSILKNSSTNFLTKSIENISAISFYSSGQE